MSTHATTVAQQLADLEAVLARSRTHERTRPMSDEEINHERLLEHQAEERKYERSRMSDWEARRIAC
jgi:hypothetical protein